MSFKFSTAEIKKESTMNAGGSGRPGVTPKVDKRIFSDPRYQSGVLFYCDSEDFPFIVRARINGSLYLFPDSLLFEFDELFIIRRTAKMTKRRPLKVGERIWFRADCRRIVEDFILMDLDEKSIQNVYECVGVFSPDLLQCWTRLYGVLPLRVPAMNVVPNVAYTINVDVKAYLEEGTDDDIPTPRLTYQMERVTDVVFRDVFTDQYYLSIYSAPWNSSRERIPFCSPANSKGDYYDQPDTPLLIKPPRTYTGDQMPLWLLQNKEVLWSANPKFRAVLAMPRTTLVLEPGTQLEGQMFYCEFDKHYVVHRHRAVRSKIHKTPEGKAAIIKLPSRRIIENGQETDSLEYRLSLKPSQYAGFFVCAKTVHTLFEDRKNLFLKAILPNTDQIDAWVTPNGQDRVARFTVTALDEQQNYKLVAAPIINGVGFQANNRTGSVFSETHPTKCIFLAIPDTTEIQIGEYFQFEAVYHETRNAFMITSTTPMKNRPMLKPTPYGDSNLFKDTIYCKNMRASHQLYRSKNFVLVTDSEDIILNKCKKENEDLYDEISVYVMENTDSNRSTFFNVFGLTKPSEKELALNEPSMSPSMRSFAHSWWRSKTSRGECKHHKAAEVCDEILAQTTEYEGGAEKLSKLLQDLRNL
ncbi:hypothetical protein Ddc_06542 [Ditylenchus destructor]|nr:hypothetical protein Ddc_06542 [Ditylenchus destructor]